MKYVGQTGPSCRTRFQEHNRVIKCNNANFATHFLEHQLTLGKINDTIEILHNTKKGRTMYTIERYYFHKGSKNGKQINDKHTAKPNRIYETIIEGEFDRMRLRKRPNTGQA